MIIYCYINTINGKRYVGITDQTLEDRWNKHLTCVRDGSGYRFHQAIRKHGAEAFESIIIDECTSIEEAYVLERYWIRLLGAKLYSLGYNMTDGGNDTSGDVIVTETRKKINDLQKLLLTKKRVNKIKIEGRV